MPTEDKRRVELLSDARVLIAWLEANPDVPVRHVEISYHVPTEDDARGLAEMRRIADVMNVPVIRSAGGAHHVATTTIGRVHYEAVYIERQYMDDYDRRQEIAASALAAERAS